MARINTNLPPPLGHAVAQLVEALRCKPEVRRFDFFIELNLLAALWA